MTSEKFQSRPRGEITSRSIKYYGLEDMSVIMPVGGKATRAHAVTHGEIPKQLIELGNGQTVLDVVCRSLLRVGFRRFVFCVGHLKDQVIDHVNASQWAHARDVSYDFSAEKTPLGADGAIVNAIGKLGLRGQALVVPGDMMLPWNGVAAMSAEHTRRGADITLGVTSLITERTSDVGKIIVEDETERVLWCYDRNDGLPPILAGSKGLTSAAATTLSTERYLDLCEAYLDEHPQHLNGPLSLRDQMLPWAIRNSDFQIGAYDVKGEALDLGTPENIFYGQKNANNYL